MSNKIKVIIKVPGQKPYCTTMNPTAETLKKRFGGEFKVYRVIEDMCIICAKDTGDLDYNCEYGGMDFYGPMIFCGYSERALLPFPDDFQIFRKLNPSLFEEFERGERAKRERASKLFGLSAVFGLWGWIGFEFARQILECI